MRLMPPARAVAVVPMLLLGAVAVAGVTRPDLVLVEHVVFEGTARATAAELRHLADVRNGAAPWEVDVDEVRAGVQRHPWVRDAAVRVAWPSTVQVTVSEHVPAALVHLDGRLLYLSEDGVPFAEASPGDLDYPHLTGLDLSGHPALPALVARDALWLLDELDVRGLVPRSAVSEIAFSDTLGFEVVAGQGRLAFAHGDLERQVDRLATLVSRGLDPLGPTWVDLAPATVAIVRPLSPDPS